MEYGRTTARQSKRRRVATATDMDMISPPAHHIAHVGPTLLSPTVKSTISESTHRGSIWAPQGLLGTRLTIEGYEDVVIDALLWDHTVGCRATSIARNGLRCWIKLSLLNDSAEQFMAEEAILVFLRERGIDFITNVLARENGGNQYGERLIITDDAYEMLSERYLSIPRAPGQQRWTDRRALIGLLSTASEIVSKLARLHALSIVHNSLSPTVIAMSSTNEVTIHEFSLAIRVGNDQPPPGRERGMSNGSLHYLAPESTRRLGTAKADYRSDYYSLGALLYEILTGSTPFASCRDPLEILHAAIAVRPALASSLDASIPASLSLLLAKLMEKEPEQRYQTSRGLIIDIERIKEALLKEQLGAATTDDFIIGSIDEAAHFRLPPPSKLFGRSEASLQIKDACDRVTKTGKGELVVVVGVSGIGKSSLVKSVYHGNERHTYSTTVKFDQIKSPVPSFAITQSLSGLLRQCLSESDACLAAWRSRLQKAMRHESRILAEVLPSLESIFPPDWLKNEPQIIELDSEKSEDRFQELVRRVLGAFARKGRKLVIVFDDLQWCGASDIHFIRSLLTKSFESTLIVCTYRDNEVGEGHIVSTGLLPHLPMHLLIKLLPLTLDDIKEFCSETLRRPVLTKAEMLAEARAGSPTRASLPRLNQSDMDFETNRLSEAVLRKTEGSPLFVAQLLKSLNSDGAFVFDFDRRRWKYDLSGIDTSSTSDVLELLIGQIRQFSPAAQYILKIASCLGNGEMQSETLAAAAGKSILELSTDLAEVISSGLLLVCASTEEEIGLADSLAEENAVISSQTFYAFFHDRCQQAAYSLIPESEQGMLRYQIGTRLVAATPPELLSSNIYHIVGQLNYGISIFSVLCTPSEREHLASLNFIAATKANRSFGFEAARMYLQIARDLLGPSGWESRYDLMCQVVEALVEAEYCLVDYKSSLEYARIYLAHAHSDHIADKLRVYVRSVKCAAGAGDIAQAIEFGIEGLASAGVILPNDAHEAGAVAAAIFADLKMTIPEIQALNKLPALEDQVVIGTLDLMAAMTASVYFTRIELIPALGALSARATITHGICPAGAFLFMVYGVCVQDGSPESMQISYEIGKVGVGYFDRVGVSSPLSCQTFKVFASHVQSWAVPLLKTEASFRKAISYSIEYRDAEYSAYGCAELASYTMLAGKPLPDIVVDLEKWVHVVRRYRHEIGILYISMVLQALYNLTGRAQDPAVFDGEAFSQADAELIQEKDYALSIHMHAMFRIMLATFLNDKPRAKEAIVLGRKYLHGGQGIIYPVFFRLFETISLFDHFDTLSEGERVILQDNINHIQHLSQGNFYQFNPMRLWLLAEESRHQHSSSDDSQYYLLSTIKRFDAAIMSAKAARMINLAACMSERCAIMLGPSKLATGYLLEAYNLWREWGCLAKTRQLESTYPHILFTTSPTLVIAAVTRLAHHVGSIVPPSAPPGHMTSAYDTAEDLPLHDEPTTVSAGSESEMYASGAVVSTSSRSKTSRGTHEDLPLIRSHQLAASLDLRAVVTAASVLSSESDVDGIVSKLLFLALRTAGAERCLLVLDEGGVLTPKAMVSADSPAVLSFQPEQSAPDFPASLLTYVARSYSITHGSWESSPVADPYLDRHRPKSMLCLALSFLSRTVGVLYCEHSEVTGAFTADRLEILSLIASQAASTIERARLVEDLRSANSNLEAKVAERTADLESAKEIAETATLNKSHFLAFTSHEVRTPMNSILALSSLLFETKLTPLQSDYVETIKNSSLELLVVINDILDVSKIENDRMELTEGIVSMREILETSLDYVTERASTKSIELALFLDRDINIIGDLVRIRQIVVNLLSNAVKFTPSHGEVVLQCKLVTNDSIDDATPPSVQIQISVKDNGIGIIDEDLKKLFLVFSQVGIETARQFGGSGLGLAISRRLAVLMKGGISVQSQIGAGSTFTLDFTAAISTLPSPSHPITAAQNLDFIGKRVLLVDNTISRSETSRLVTSFGFVVVEVLDSVNAIKALVESTTFDIIIIDALLPNASTIAQQAREMGAKQIPAIIELTRLGLASQQEGLAAIDRLFTIAKPLKKHRIFSTIRQVFPPPIGSHSFALSRTATSSSLFPPRFAAQYPLRILCAEDNPVNRKVIVSVLNRLGYSSIDLAHDGQEAVDKALKGNYDVLITDVMMPIKTGLQAAQELVRLIPDRNLRPTIVALTASATVDERNRCFEHGCTAFLPKPLLIPDLVELLENISRSRGTAIESSETSSTRSSSRSSPFNGVLSLLQSPYPMS